MQMQKVVKERIYYKEMSKQQNLTSLIKILKTKIIMKWSFLIMVNNYK